MKKIFAILMLVLMATAIVFAAAPSTGTANLKIVTLIHEIEPEFKLTTSASDSGALVGTPATVATMATPTDADGSASDAYHVIGANTMASTGTTTVTFNVVQTNDCKSYKTYTFSATAENLVMVKAYNNEGNLVAYAGTATPENHRAFAVDHTTVESFSSTGADTQFTEIVDGASSATAYKITYTGDKVEDGIVTTFSCVWTNDEAAVPGQYEANIRLTVTAN